MLVGKHEEKYGGQHWGEGHSIACESMPLMFVFMTNGLESRRPRASIEYEMDDARSVRSLLHALLSLEAPSRLSNVPKRLNAPATAVHHQSSEPLTDVVP